MASVFDIFVVGGVPSTTYNPREGRGLAVDLENLVASRHTLGAVHGPTKCGKSVLISRTLLLVTKIEGSELTSVDAFWFQLASKLDLSADERSGFEYTETAGGSLTGELGVPGVKMSAGTTTEGTVVRSREWGTARSLSDRVIERLRDKNFAVVIDDYHHAPETVRHDLVRVLKRVLFDGVPVILASVSHKAYDAVISEPEMEGRIEVIEVPTWSTDELESIANEGFRALRVDVALDVVQRLASEALGSPQLMQLFCRELCLSHDVREEQDSYVRIDQVDWASFFGNIARRSTAVSRLTPIKLGPKERGHQRERMITKDGQEVDIYGAILLAVSRCGPLNAIPYRDLRSAISDVLSEGNPNATQIKNTLFQQTQIAAKLVENHEFVDPVIHWDGEVLHVIDPFFSFFVRWGELGLVRPARDIAEDNSVGEDKPTQPYHPADQD